MRIILALAPVYTQHTAYRSPAINTGSSLLAFCMVHVMIYYVFVVYVDTVPRWRRNEQQLLLLKSASSTSTKVYQPGDLNIGCHNESVSEPLLHSLNGSKKITADEGVAVYTTEHIVVSGNFSCSVEDEQSSANDEFSNERPINIISPHTNSEQVIRQEVTTPQCSNIICSGLQPLPLPPTYLSIKSLRSHSINHDPSKLPMLKGLQYPECSHCSGKQLDIPQTLKSEGTWTKKSWCYADMERGPLYYANHYVSKAFSGFGIEETVHRPGNQELVLSCPFTLSKCSHRHNHSTQYTRTERSALDRPELYIKPFTVLVPD